MTENTRRMTSGPVEEPSDPSEFDLLSAHDRVSYLADLLAEDAYQRPTGPRLAADKQAKKPCLLSTDEWLSRPEPAWMIEGLIPESGFTVLAGHHGLGKSFIALDIAAHLSIGRSWFGRTSRQVRVIYAELEGMHPSRVKGWQKHNNIDSLPGLDWYVEGVNLKHDAQQGDLITMARDNGTGLFILDTLNRSISGFEENSSVDMGAVIGFADRLRREAACTLLVVHHAPRGGDHPRGHSSLEAAADTVLGVTKRKKDLHILKVTKQRNGLDGTEVKFRIVKDSTTGGAFIAAVGPTQHLDQLTPNERRLVQALVQDPPVLPTTHGRIKKVMEDQDGMASSSLNAALKALVIKEVLEKNSSSKGALYDWTATGHEAAQKLMSNDGPT